MEAAKGGNTGVLKMLLHWPHLDINARDDENRTAFSHIVCSTFSWNFAQIVQIFFNYPGVVDLDTRDCNGRTPLSYAVTWQYDVDCIRMLLSVPTIDAGSVDNNGRSILTYAVESRLPIEAIRLLLAAPGIDVGSVDNFGRSNLYYAVRTGMRVEKISGQVELVRLLLSAPGIDASTVDSDGRSILFHAVMRARQNSKNMTDQALSGFGAYFIDDEIDNCDISEESRIMSSGVGKADKFDQSIIDNAQNHDIALSLMDHSEEKTS